MGFMRFLFKTIVPGGRIGSALYNMVDEGSVVDGIKRTVREEITEDNLITSTVYKYGKSDGKQDGYIQASHEYEQKLLEQADLFLSQKEKFEKERNAYEELLDAYEEKICELQKNNKRTEDENDLLRKLLSKYKMLKRTF